VNPPFDDRNAAGNAANDPEGPNGIEGARPRRLSIEVGQEWGVQDVHSSRQSIIEFHRRLFELTPRVLVTRLIVAVNLVVFALMALSSGTLFSPSGETLIEWGGNFGPKTLGDEPWRVFTSMFIHIGIIHVGLNMWVLWDAGHLVERLVGNVGFLVLYVISGLFGSVASVYWNNNVLSAGASGAVFGVFGALMGFIMLRGDSIPKSILGPLRNSGFAFLGYNLIFGFAIDWIDNAAHIGGLAAGFVCGVLMSHSLARTTKTSRAVRVLLTAAVGALALLAAASFAPEPPVDFAGIEEKVVNALNAAAGRWERGEMSNREFAEVVESDVLPPWREIRRQLDKKTDAPRIRQQYDPKLTEYVRAREEQWEALLVRLRSPTNTAVKKHAQKKKIADQLAQELSAR